MTAVHELLTLDITVFSNAQVYAALEKNLPAAGGRLLGAFASDIGELSQVLVWREFPDANALAEARDTLLGATDPLGCGPCLTGLRSESYRMLPFLPAVEGSKAGKEEGGNVYEFRNYQYKQGMTAQTLAAWQEALPARHALSPLVGALTALDGVQPRLLNIWAYKTLEERARVRADAVKQGIWPPKGGPASLAAMRSTVCVPVPFSPLK